jgi:hypothetical protein
MLDEKDWGEKEAWLRQYSPHPLARVSTSRRNSAGTYFSVIIWQPDAHLIHHDRQTDAAQPC